MRLLQNLSLAFILASAPLFAFGQADAELDGAPPVPSLDRDGIAATLRLNLENLKGRLSLFTPDFLPHQIKLEAVKLRKNILYARTVLDLLPHSFPLREEVDGSLADPWAEFREELDEGYDRVGDFKDLYDVVAGDIGKGDALGLITLEDYRKAYRIDPREPDEDWLSPEIERRRGRVLAWIAGLDFDARIGSLAGGVLNPLPPGTHELRRDRDDTSALYWGALKAQPDPRLSPENNVRRLAALLLIDLVNSGVVEEVLAIEDVVEEQEPFHELRKRIRAVIQISSVAGLEGFIPEALASAPCWDRLDLLVDGFGDVNDLITRHFFYGERHEESGKKPERELWEFRLREVEIDIAFAHDKLKDFTRQGQLDQDLFDAASLLLRAIAPTAGQLPPQPPAFQADLVFDPASNAVFQVGCPGCEAGDLPFAVEIPTGASEKFELRTATGQVILDRMNCPREVAGTDRTIHAYPASYGISPGRFNVDGDPIDLLVLGATPVYESMVRENTVVPRRVRVIGVLRMEECETVPCQGDETWLPDWKVLAVDPADPGYAQARSLADVPDELERLEEFFSNYKGRVDGHPLTRVVGVLDRPEALEYIATFRAATPAERALEVMLCDGVFETILDLRDVFELDREPPLSESYLRCLQRVFHAEFFEDVKAYDFFIRYSAYQLLAGDLDVEGVTLDNALELMARLKSERQTHYRFVGYDLPAPGTGNAIFEWVKTKDRNVGCPDGFPPQHYESRPIAPTWEELLAETPAREPVEIPSVQAPPGG